MLTAAVRDLKRAHGSKYDIGVHTSAMQLWDNNPYVNLKVQPHKKDVTSLHIGYKQQIQQSNQKPFHFISAFHRSLEIQLKEKIPVSEFKGDIHLAQWEKDLDSQVKRAGHEGPYWIIVCGGKSDVSCKWPNPEHMQKVVDHFDGKIKFVQCGLDTQKGNIIHKQFRLNNVIDLINKTDIRQYVRTMYHAQGVLCPVTFSMHLAAAVQNPHSEGSRPCVVVAGGREPPHWEAYPNHQFLHTVGQLDCCAKNPCWKSTCQMIKDGGNRNTENKLCKRPVQVYHDLRVPECINMIGPNKIIESIENYFGYGVCAYL